MSDEVLRGEARFGRGYSRGRMFYARRTMFKQDLELMFEAPYIELISEEITTGHPTIRLGANCAGINMLISMLEDLVAEEVKAQYTGL